MDCMHEQIWLTGMQLWALSLNDPLYMLYEEYTQCLQVQLTSMYYIVQFFTAYTQMFPKLDVISSGVVLDIKRILRYI